MKGAENEMIKKEKIKRLAGIFAAGILTLSMAFSFTGCKDDENSDSRAADVLESMTDAPTQAPTAPPIENISADNGLTARAKVLLRENEDVVGYIRISNTNVDYPVVQYDGEDLEEEGNAYYLDKDLYGNYYEPGTIFMDYRDNFEADESKQSENIVLYGHNMLSGAMFADLHKYRQDESFYDENPIIEFSSNYRDYQYVIFGYLVTSGDMGESSYGENFDYWNLEELDTESDFNDYIRIVNERTFGSPDVDVAYGDKLLTLSTCWMDEDNSRMLLVARRLRDHETVDNIDRKTNDGATADPTEADDEDTDTEAEEQTEE